MSSSIRLVASRGLSRPALRTSRLASVSAAASVRAFTTQQNNRYSRQNDQQYQAPRTSKAGPSPGILGVIAVGALAGWYFYNGENPADASASSGSWKKVNYNNVYKDIADLLEDENYDDGSYGPVFVRLAWHASGTFDKKTRTGGSGGATIRFEPEATHGANAGLEAARERLEPLKKKYPHISYGDLYTLAGVVAVQELGGPTVAWRPGRKDKTAAECTPDGRLPDAAQGADHVRDIFYRMGFNDQEIAALIGAHALGRCHTSRSGYDGPWNASPTSFTNFYYTELLNNTWEPKKWNGPFQYVDRESGQFMMLPADMAFKKDSRFRAYVEKYAADQDAFFEDFAKAFAKLLELGVNFPEDAPVYNFKPLDVRLLKPALGAVDPLSSDFKEVFPLPPRKDAGPETLPMLRVVFDGEIDSVDDRLVMDLSEGEEPTELSTGRLITGDFGEDNKAPNDEFRCCFDEPRVLNDDRVLEGCEIKEGVLDEKLGFVTDRMLLSSSSLE
ncbi:heme peroxidase [Coemansia sp. IMI 203386]|nr:heme peroxidase [Coemansia sp. IMI 203386]